MLLLVNLFCEPKQRHQRRLKSVPVVNLSSFPHKPQLINIPPHPIPFRLPRTRKIPYLRRIPHILVPGKLRLCMRNWILPHLFIRYLVDGTDDSSVETYDARTKKEVFEREWRGTILFGRDPRSRRACLSWGRLLDGVAGLFGCLGNCRLMEDRVCEANESSTH